MFNKNIIIKLVVCVGFMFTSCEKILEPVPEGQPSAKEFYTNYYGALTGLNGCYNSLAITYNAGADAGGSYWFVDVLSDDGSNESSSLTDARQWELLTIEPANTQIQLMWTNLYQGIYRCNLILSQWESIYDKELGNRKIAVKQFAGEAYFLRALFYNHLVQLYGGVPIMTTPESETDKLKIPRNTVDEVYAQIISDCNEALKHLPVQHPNPLFNGSTQGLTGGNEIGRATTGAVQALLSSVYLTRNELDKSLEQITNLKALARTTPYRLATNYSDNYPNRGGTENNVESIFEIQYAASAGALTTTGLRMDLRANSGNGFNMPTDDANASSNADFGGIKQMYQSIDARLPVNINYAGSPLLPRVFKHIPDVLADRSNSGTNWSIYRFAEILLNEAEIKNAKGDQAGAIAAVDQIRIRAKIPTLLSLNVTNPTAIRDSIRSERRRELAFEAKRWFDLNRWGITVKTMTDHGRPMKDFQKILPIPRLEFNRNPTLVQNPGYSN